MVGRSLPVSPGIYTGRAKVVAGSVCGLLQSKDCNRLQMDLHQPEAKVIMGFSYYYL